MPAFEYEALDASGALKTGVVSADNARLARRELRQIRLMPVRIAPVTLQHGRAGGWIPALRSRTRIKPAAMMLLTRQLATMVSAAAPLEEALHTIALQADDKAVRGTLLAVRTSVTEGMRLADALALHPDVFSPLYRALIAAGELSGHLGTVLERLADHLEKTERLRAKVATALIYPIVLSAVAAGVVMILMTFVVPKVIAQFDSLGQDLPLLTRILVFVSESLAAYGWLLLALCVGAGIAASRALRRPAIRRRVDAFSLRLPVIGKLLRGLYAARLARTLGTLVASGSPITDGLVAAKATISNVVLADAVGAVGIAIHEGASLSQAIRRTGLFPPMIVYMAAVGESTGRLEVMLTKAAEHLEREFETFTTTAIGLLEPLIVVFMGGVVAMIVLAILLPILQLNSIALM
jgi:general secretion pathway protein F